MRRPARECDHPRMAHGLEAMVIRHTRRVPRPRGSAGEGGIAARQFDTALMTVGFKLSAPLLGRLSALSEAAVPHTAGRPLRTEAGRPPARRRATTTRLLFWCAAWRPPGRRRRSRHQRIHQGHLSPSTWISAGEGHSARLGSTVVPREAAPSPARAYFREDVPGRVRVCRPEHRSAGRARTTGAATSRRPVLRAVPSRGGLVPSGACPLVHDAHRAWDRERVRNGVTAWARGGPRRSTDSGPSGIPGRPGGSAGARPHSSWRPWCSTG